MKPVLSNLLSRCVQTSLLLGLSPLAWSQANTATATTAAPAMTAPAINSAGSLAQVLLGLAVVLALMFAVAWMMKRFGMARPNGNQTVKLVGGINVGNRERVLVVEVNEQWIVVGVAPGRVNALATLPKGSNAGRNVSEGGASTSSEAPARSFASWLQAKTSAKN